MDVSKNFQCAENYKKLSLDGDGGRKGPAPVWEVLRLEAWSPTWPSQSSIAFTFPLLGATADFKQRSLVMKLDSQGRSLTHSFIRSSLTESSGYSGFDTEDAEESS